MGWNESPIVRTENRALTGIVQSRRHLEAASHELEVARRIFSELAGHEVACVEAGRDREQA